MDLNNKALKSGLIYAAASIINAGLVFLITPYFTRTMGKESYGAYNNFLSWYNILSVLSLNLHASFISARRDYRDEYCSYIKSMFVLNFIILGVYSLIIFAGKKWFLGLFGFDTPYMMLMLAYIAFYQVFMMYQVNERFSYRYKIAVLLIVVCAITTAAMSMVLVVTMKNQLLGRVIGLVVPSIVVGIVSGILLVKRGEKVNLKHWKYVLPICIPYIPHLLSLSLLNSLDKAMITSMVGSAETAIYSVAYTCGSVISLVVGVLNNAFAPWMTNKIDSNEAGEVKKVSIIYVSIFQIILGGVLIWAPELVYILGGKDYMDAVSMMPAIIIGCSMQLIYTMYVNIEQYYKKTSYMAIVSIIAALLNALLNYMLIPIRGYKIAAITTLISYLVLVLGHICVVKKMGYSEIYNTKVNLIIIFCELIAVPFFFVVYSFDSLRLIVGLVYLIVVSGALWRKKKQIIKMICLIKKA